MRTVLTLSLTLTASAIWLAPEARAQPRQQSTAAATYALPLPDAALQSALRDILRQPPYRRLTEQNRISVALVDLTDPDQVRYAGFDADRMRYTASLPKIGILVGVFDQIERGRVRYTPALREKLELMIRNSDNAIASEMIRLVGFENIARTLQAPRHQLFDPGRRGGIWVGRGYGGIGLWRRDPLANISHGATARQAARFFVLIERGELVSPWASAEMKSILSDPAIHHKFVRGLEVSRPGSRIFRKSGTWRNYHSDAALVERDGRRYVAVVLLESPTNSTQGVLASLIVRLDDLVFRPPTAIDLDR